MSPYYQDLRDALGDRLLLIPAVAALIHDEAGRLLLQQKHDGSWSLPAGAIEPGETPEEAVAREVREETGLACVGLEIAGHFGGEAFRYNYPNGARVEYLILLFRCEARAEGEPTDPEETKDLCYFSRTEMPELALPYDLDLLFARPPFLKFR